MARRITKISDKSLNQDSLDGLLQNNINKYKTNLKKNFSKLQGRNFGLFHTKFTDDLLKMALDGIYELFFGIFTPHLDKIPLCAIALENYAKNYHCIGDKAEILVVFMDVEGFCTKNISKQFYKTILALKFDANIQILNIDEIFENAKDDDLLKSKFCYFRYVCGSKTVYKFARSELNRLKEYKKYEFIQKRIQNLHNFNEIEFINQEPNLLAGYGGISDINETELILNYVCEEQNIKSKLLEFITEKELSELNLSIDDIVSLRNALRISGGSDTAESSYLENISKIMQTKEKKMLDTKILIAQKMLSSLHQIAIYSRYIAYCATEQNLQNIDTKDRFFCENGIVYSKIDKENAPLEEIVRDLANLPDTRLKFHISAIFTLKRALQESTNQERMLNEFKRILNREFTYDILNALLNSEILFVIIKPMSHTRYLAEFDRYHKYSVDDHSVLGVYHLENIKDPFAKSLYDDLCADGKLMMKLTILMHDVGKGFTGDHSIVGSNIFRAYANKLSMSQKAINMGVTLIKNHTLMYDVANRDDIYNQRVILGFISQLGEKQALKNLYILTYCYILSVNETLYNSYIAKLLRELYQISMENFDDAGLLDEATRRAKKEASLKKQSEFNSLSSDKQRKIFQIPSNLFFIKYQSAEILKIALWALNAQEDEFSFENSETFSLEIIGSKQTNIAYLLKELANFDLGYMEIFELFDERVYIKLEFNLKFQTKDETNIKSLVKNALQSKISPEIDKPQILPSELNFDLEHSKTYAKLNINTKDQRGLMAYVMSVFGKYNIKITSARIQTIKNRTRNLFLIQKSVRLSENYNIILKLLTKKDR